MATHHPGAHTRNRPYDERLTRLPDYLPAARKHRPAAIGTTDRADRHCKRPA